MLYEVIFKLSVEGLGATEDYQGYKIFNKIKLKKVGVH